MFAQKIEQPVRKIIYRTRGHTSGPITRLMSPGDLGELLKPFVFLDLAEFDGATPPMPIELGWHPHSGIATVTVMLDGTIRFQETTGRDGSLPAGGVEWMRAGNGVWHTGAAEPGRAKAFQLWVALPPELENGPNASQYLMREDVPVVGPARVILGSYGDAKSSIASPPMTYLHVQLKAGERWTYQPARGHDVAFIAVHDGAVRTGSSTTLDAGELAIFEQRDAQAIDFTAETDTGFVLGSAARHPHPLVLGSYSVHTSVEALRSGQKEIRRIGQELRAAGVLRRI